MFQKLGFHTSNKREIFKNNVRLTLYLCKFAAIQTSQHTYLKEKTTAFPWRRKTEDPLVEMDQCEDQSKDILNELSQCHIVTPIHW